jgi:hypothetical protein
VPKRTIGDFFKRKLKKQQEHKKSTIIISSDEECSNVTVSTYRQLYINHKQAPQLAIEQPSEQLPKQPLRGITINTPNMVGLILLTYTTLIIKSIPQSYANMVLDNMPSTSNQDRFDEAAEQQV